MISVAETTGDVVAGACRRTTALAPVKPVPVMVTAVAPGRRPGRRADALHGRGRLVGELVGDGWWRWCRSGW